MSTLIKPQSAAVRVAALAFATGLLGACGHMGERHHHGEPLLLVSLKGDEVEVRDGKTGNIVRPSGSAKIVRCGAESNQSCLQFEPGITKSELTDGDTSQARIMPVNFLKVGGDCQVYVRKGKVWFDPEGCTP